MTPEQTHRLISLKDRSDVFNYVIDHLRRQGLPSLASGLCAYRGENGTMCAAGALMTDEEYDPRWELKMIDDLCRGNLLPNLLRERIEPHLDMVADLQKFHDNYLEYDDGIFNKCTEEFVYHMRNKWNIQ